MILVHGNHVNLLFPRRDLHIEEGWWRGISPWMECMLQRHELDQCLELCISLTMKQDVRYVTVSAIIFYIIKLVEFLCNYELMCVFLVFVLLQLFSPYKIKNCNSITRQNVMICISFIYLKGTILIGIVTFRKPATNVVYIGLMGFVYNEIFTLFSSLF